MFIALQRGWQWSQTEFIWSLFLLSVGTLGSLFLIVFTATYPKQMHIASINFLNVQMTIKVDVMAAMHAIEG